MNDDLAPLLSTLPEPLPPSAMTANVMARIEREVAAQHMVASSPSTARHSRDVSMWVWASLGIVLVAGATGFSWYVHGLPDVLSPRVLRGGIDAGLSGWQATLAGIAGLMLCLRALFSPLRSR
jgi:hypothetical protein